jgi:hypothetical protein
MKGTVTINGASYNHSLFWNTSPDIKLKKEYRLGGLCDRLSYTAGVDDRSPTDAKIGFTVEGDNRQLDSFEAVVGQSRSQTLNLSGVRTLRLTATGLGWPAERGYWIAAWGDARVRCTDQPS